MSSGVELAEKLRQMLAVLEAERQALAALDLGALMAATAVKQDLCTMLEAQTHAAPGGECVALLESAKRQNEINRKVRNLLAANIATRLDTLRRTPGLYSVRTSEIR